MFRRFASILVGGLLVSACSGQTTAEITSAEETSSTPGAGEVGGLCGTIAGLRCHAGLSCKYDGDYPDAAGTCIDPTAHPGDLGGTCGTIAGIQCHARLRCKLHGPEADAEGTCIPATACGAPYLVKTVTPGLVPESLAITTRCEVYEDKVVHFVEGPSISTRSEVELRTTGDLGALIAQAAAGHVTEQPAPTDGPVTSYQATFADSQCEPRVAELKSEGSRILKNDAPAAATLVLLLDDVCR
jgi:hypothetical protein